MTTARLPAGWEQWSAAEKRLLLQTLQAAADEARMPRWETIARPNQLAPAGDWDTWLVLAGRGFGKTRVGSEWAHTKARTCARGSLIAPTAADARDVMIEGESGLLATARPTFRPVYEPSKRRVTWPNGAQAAVYSAEEPDRLRGPQHEWGWGDEFAAWPALTDVWDNWSFGLRLGPHPQRLLTSTPRPRPLVKALLADPHAAVTRGSTYDNLANLAPSFRERILAKYEGTRLGRQELLAEVLEDVEGALWSWSQFDAPGFRLDPRDPRTPAILDGYPRGCVAVDPAVTSGENADATAIVAACTNGQAGVVLRSRQMRDSPLACMAAAVDLALDVDVDTIVVERNNGGDYLTTVARQVTAQHPDPRARALRIRTVVATRGKALRAQPVAGLYEQQRVQHLGVHADLEREMTEWTDEKGQASPNLLDALVWALTALMVGRTVGPARAAST